MNASHDYLLIVEDDPDILKLLDAALTFRGYHVVTARNGEEGLEMIQRQYPAIIIADIMMPKMSIYWAWMQAKRILLFWRRFIMPSLNGMN